MDTNTPSHLESLYPPESRYHEIEQIVSFVKEGNSCQIVSLPGVGRSNLLGLLSYNRAVRIKHFGENQGKFHFVLLNFSEIRNRPLLDATKFIFLALVDSLRERKMDEEYRLAQGIFKESLSFGDELVLFQGLKRVIDLFAMEKELTIVFLFDRFESYVPMLTTEFFTNLRVLRNRAKYRFSVVFSLNRPLEEIVDATLLADFYEFVAGHSIYLPLLDEPGLSFRLSYLAESTGKKIDLKASKAIISLTAGHGKLTRLCTESLLSSSAPSAFSPETLVPYLLEQKTVVGGLYEIWYALTPVEQEFIQTLPLGETNDYLMKVGLVKEGKISLPLFQAFVENQKKQVVTGKKSSTISLNANTNDIVKGDQILSDKLTAGEYRLLRFLIQNPERVVDREEIITAVWQDAKSTAGVTDQALDQLIFRVRKKIETDPESPEHLHTVKGRGFRFTL